MTALMVGGNAERRCHMKLKVMMVAGMLFGILVGGMGGAEAKGRGPCVGMSVRETIVCAEKLWPVPGGVDVPLYIADRESGFSAGAVSPSGTYVGVFQIGSYHMPAWPDGLMGAPWFHRWFPNLSWDDPGALLNGRFNVFLAIRFANAYGWDPWQV